MCCELVIEGKLKAKLPANNYNTSRCCCTKIEWMIYKFWHCLPFLFVHLKCSLVSKHGCLRMCLSFYWTHLNGTVSCLFIWVPKKSGKISRDGKFLSGVMEETLTRRTQMYMMINIYNTYYYFCYKKNVCFILSKSFC